MRTYYRNEDDKVLCFKHAVLGALQGEEIRTVVENISDDPYDSTVSFEFEACDKCTEEIAAAQARYDARFT